MKELVALVVAISATALGNAQTVYRCGNAYSDEPCNGGKTVEIRATDGAHSMSGQKRTSNEAINRRNERAFDKAFAPYTGISPEEAQRRREERRQQAVPRIKIEP